MTSEQTLKRTKKTIEPLPTDLVYPDVEEMAIRLVAECLDEIGIPRFGPDKDRPRVGYQLPRSFRDKDAGPFVTVSLAGESMDPLCVGRSTVHPVTRSTLSITVYGSDSDPAKRMRERFRDPCTMKPFRTAKAEASYLARQLRAHMISAGTGFRAHAGITLGVIADRLFFSPEPGSNRSRYVMTFRMDVRATGKK